MLTDPADSCIVVSKIASSGNNPILALPITWMSPGKLHDINRFLIVLRPGSQHQGFSQFGSCESSYPGFHMAVFTISRGLCLCARGNRRGCSGIPVYKGVNPI